LHTACCACGNIIPAYSSDRRSWRMDTRDRRFRRRFQSSWRGFGSRTRTFAAFGGGHL
jgi:hypothetical protein